MKKVLYWVLIMSILAACGHETDKKGKLARLKKEYAQLGEQIKKLEQELSQTGDPSNQKVIPVGVTEVQPGEFRHYLEVQGSIDGEENVAVNARMAGVVTTIYVREGDAVRKGQLLAGLDAEVLRKSIDEVKHQLGFATNIYNKQKNLWDQKIGSEIQYLTAKNNKESLENSLKTLEEQLDMMQVTSPIDGTVEEIPIKVGQAVAPGYPVFRVINFSSVKVVANVAEVYAPKINKGDEVLIYFPDMDKEVRSNISFTSKYINPTNRSFVTEVRLKPGEIEARANMIAVVRINDYKVDSALSVPVNVIQNSPEGQYVFLAVENAGHLVARRCLVEPGITYNGLTEIKGGLKPGDRVITAGYQDLNEGQPISF